MHLPSKRWRYVKVWVAPTLGKLRKTLFLGWGLNLWPKFLIPQPLFNPPRGKGRP